MEAKALERTETVADKFWKSSLLLFLALRLADVVNAFAGIYLVPKYVGAKELGAVLPLANFAGFLSLPVLIVATVFMRQVAVLAEEKAFGEIKSLVRGMFVAGAVVFAAALFGAKMVMDDFLERLRIEEGSLAFLIVASAVAAAMAPVYSNVLVALKRFKTLSLLNFFSAPVRVASMLLLMPFRALSGYFAAQATPGIFVMLGSIAALRKELAVKAKPFWTRSRLREVSVFGAATALFVVAPSLQSLLETTALRQCLAANDSAAYYMVTRFSEIAAYAGATLATVLFPFAVGANSLEVRKIVKKAMAASIAISVVLAGGFALSGSQVLALLPDGAIYSGYTGSLVALTLVAGANSAAACAVNWLLASGRRRWLWWWCLSHIGYSFAFWMNSRYGQWSLASIIAVQAGFTFFKLVAAAFSLRLR